MWSRSSRGLLACLLSPAPRHQPPVPDPGPHESIPHCWETVLSLAQGQLCNHTVHKVTSCWGGGLQVPVKLWGQLLFLHVRGYWWFSTLFVQQLVRMWWCCSLKAQPLHLTTHPLTHHVFDLQVTGEGSAPNPPLCATGRRPPSTRAWSPFRTMESCCHRDRSSSPWPTSWDTAWALQWVGRQLQTTVHSHFHWTPDDDFKLRWQ